MNFLRYINGESKQKNINKNKINTYMNKETKQHVPNKWGLTKHENSQLDVFHDEFDSFVERAFNWAWANPVWVTNRNYRFCDIKTENDKYTITVELPGYKKNELKLEVIDGSLQLTAENAKGKYVKSWSLSDSDLDKVTSKLEDGVLHINIPKLPKAEIKVVTIE
jgi:HSP20 family protein